MKRTFLIFVEASVKQGDKIGLMKGSVKMETSLPMTEKLLAHAKLQYCEEVKLYKGLTIDPDLSGVTGAILLEG